MPACILVVDDESTTTDALELLLRDHDYDVSTSATAAEAEIKRGAFYYLEKPFTFDQILILTQRAKPPRRSSVHSHQLRRDPEHADRIGIVRLSQGSFYRKKHKIILCRLRPASHRAEPPLLSTM